MNPKFGTYKLSQIQELVLDIIYALPRNCIGRRCALLFRKVFTSVWKQQLFDHNIEGINARFCIINNVSERKFFFMPQFYDYNERQFIATHLSPRAAVFVDIGANIGLYSLWAASCMRSGVVLSFEPNPELFKRLQDNISINKFTCSIITENIAIADATDEAASLFLDPSNLGGATMHQKRRESNSPYLTIKTKTLLEALHQHRINKIDILKIDIEGFEEKALLPFFDAAEKALYPRFIIIEDNSKLWQTDLFSALNARGYRVLQINKMNYILELAEAVNIEFPSAAQTSTVSPALD